MPARRHQKIVITLLQKTYSTRQPQHASFVSLLETTSVFALQNCVIHFDCTQSGIDWRGLIAWNASPCWLIYSEKIRLTTRKFWFPSWQLLLRPTDLPSVNCVVWLVWLYFSLFAECVAESVVECVCPGVYQAHTHTNTHADARQVGQPQWHA